MTKRLWEIDFLRGGAIIMMIIFHFLYDLYYFGYGLDVHTGFWWLFARITASIFIVLVGVSLTLSHARTKKGFGKYLKRGLKIFGWGLLITIMTYLFIQDGFIIFGILHFIGVSIILAYWFLRYNVHRYILLVLGVIVFIVGTLLNTIMFNFPWLLWLGFVPHFLYTLDYFPLLPWFGLVLVGMYLGKTIYPGGKRRLKDVSHRLTNFFSFLGRHSLLIYLIHQPVLIAILYIFVL